MATLHETAYPRLKPDPTAKELDEISTPSGGEVRLARSMATQPTTRPMSRGSFRCDDTLAFAVMYFCPLSDSR